MHRVAGVVFALLIATGIVAAAQPDDTADTATLTRAPVITAAPTTQPPTTTTDPYTMSVSFLDELSSLVADSPANTCLVVSANGQRVFSHLPDAPLLPASTMKVLTAAAALDLINADERFLTQAKSATPIVDGRLSGDLWLVGGGDPVLATSDFIEFQTREPIVATPVEALADQLVAAGLTVIEGRILADDGRYDGARYVETWKQGYLDDHESGPLGAMLVNRGFLTYRPHEPAVNPAVHSADVLRWLLGLRGVEIIGDSASGAVPADVQPLAQVASPPESDIVGQMLRMSDNTVAELQLKEVGLRAAGQGTTAAGAQVVHEALARRGIDNSAVTVVDGSGLDRGNRLTCDVLTRVLEVEGRRSTLANGLAVAGRVGTLARRWIGTPVEGRLLAKSGSIDGVISLTGFFDGPTDALTFSYIQNGDHPIIDGFARRDQLGQILARHADAGTIFGGMVVVPRPGLEPPLDPEVQPEPRSEVGLPFDE